jgi:hypothetical protein
MKKIIISALVMLITSCGPKQDVKKNNNDDGSGTSEPVFTQALKLPCKNVMALRFLRQGGGRLEFFVNQGANTFFIRSIRYLSAAVTHSDLQLNITDDRAVFNALKMSFDINSNIAGFRNDQQNTGTTFSVDFYDACGNSQILENATIVEKEFNTELQIVEKFILKKIK